MSLTEQAAIASFSASERSLVAAPEVSFSVAGSEIQKLEKRILDLETYVRERKMIPSDSIDVVEGTNLGGEAEDISEDSDAEDLKDRNDGDQDEDREGDKNDGESGDSTNPKGPPSRYSINLWKWDPNTATYDVKPEASKVESKTEENVSKDQQAFTYRKYVARGRSQTRADITFGSELLSLLRRLIAHYNSHIWDDGILDEPFEPLVLNWDLLSEEVKREDGDEDEKQTREDLKILMNIIATNSGDERLNSYFETREANRQSGTITYDTLWTIFPPGELVYSRPFLNLDQLFLVQDYVYIWPISGPRRKKSSSWTLICWSYEWDGTVFERKAFELDIDPFIGSLAINALPVYPVKYYHDKEGRTWEESLKKKLLDRGRRFREICTTKRGSRTFNYTGVALSRGKGLSVTDNVDEDMSDGHTADDDMAYDNRDSPQRTVVAPKRSQVKGNVMVDYEAYFRYSLAPPLLGTREISQRERECGCSSCQNNTALSQRLKFDYDQVTADVEPEEWEEVQFLICSPRVLGYSMRDGFWAQLQVDLVKRIKVDPASDAYDQKLSLDQDTKALIKDLIVNHEHGKRRDGKGAQNGLDDLVDDKGKGLVILLHGVGKTLTAESVAISTGKPLFSVGVADIGTRPHKAERNLRRFFDLATEWEAVMLIDEADVFLNSRGQGETNLEKNALVSVLLRVLEYYEGILILTTNRINSFDVAVQSRVHVAIRYDNLDPTQTRDIYLTFLQQVKDDGNIADWKALSEWVNVQSRNSDFNGRQIRNVVSSALGLARAKKDKLNTEYLDKIVDRTRTFHKLLSKQRQMFEMKQIAGGQER